MTKREIRYQRKVYKFLLSRIGIVAAIYAIIIIILVSIKLININYDKMTAETFVYAYSHGTNIETESQEEAKKFQSSMELMITGKEVAKGDYEHKIQKIKLNKRKEKERKRKEAHIKKKELEILAHLIEGEAGDQNDNCQQAVGQVVMNRVNSKGYPNSIESVVFQKGQYACTWDGNYDRTPSKQAYRNAKAVLTGNVCIKVPENVVFQSQFKQGSGVWKKIGTETFCY